MVGPPLWKIWKSIGMISNPIYGKIKVMFQSTNQIWFPQLSTCRPFGDDSPQPIPNQWRRTERRTERRTSYGFFYPNRPSMTILLNQVSGNLDSLLTWFRSHRATPSHHAFLAGIFPEINHRAIGVPPWLWKPPTYVTARDFPTNPLNLPWRLSC